MRAGVLLRSTGMIVLLAIALAALLAQGGTTPHTHPAWQPGLYNQEHDLTALATFGAVAPLPGSTTAPWFVVVVSAAPALAAGSPAGAPLRHADPRAPPAPLG